MQPRSVKQIPTAHYFAILDRPPVACIPAAANDDADPAAGGKLGVVVMVAVAIWVFGGAFVVERFL